MSGLQAIRYTRGRLLVLNQLLLPHQQHYDEVSSCEEAFDGIRCMRVRGAPAIAIVAALALAVELHRGSCTATSVEDTIRFIDGRLDYLKGSRPTAVDLTNAISHLKAAIRADAPQEDGPVTRPKSQASVIETFIVTAEAIFARDLQTNLAIAKHGSDWLARSEPGVGAGAEAISVLTHCNTGSLATSGHGTALGIIRTMHARGLVRHVFFTETRPYNQGGRLTSFELLFEGIPCTLVTDSMVGALFRCRGRGMNIGAVIVGADRVARNGDTANKIGTYQLAVLARHHDVRFVVAAPTTSVDLETETGGEIEIEEREGREVTQVSGAVVAADGTLDGSRTARVAIADQRVKVWNPAFDVTPADLIDAIVTERGAVVKKAQGIFDFSEMMPERWAEVSS